MELQGSAFCCLMSLSHLPPPDCTCVVSSLETLAFALSPRHLSIGGAESLETPSCLETQIQLALQGMSLFLLFTVLGSDTCSV